jgi:trimeric autotransporter adhesin
MQFMASVADPGYSCSKGAKTKLTELNHMKRAIKIQTASFPSGRHCRQVLFTLGFLALLPVAQAVTPAPDGGYRGYNTAEGQNALFSLSTGVYNTSVGAFSLYSDTTGAGNTAVGVNVLRNNVTGTFNTGVGLNALYFNNGDPTVGLGINNCAFGSYALFTNAGGRNNSAFGYGALASNTTIENSAFGAFALFANTEGEGNTAMGFSALAANTTGGLNSAFGWSALASNIDGAFNTATGNRALQNNTSGSDNTANGYIALFINQGSGNTATGSHAMQLNSTGDNNTATGLLALYGNNGDNNTAVGANALSNNSTGTRNSALGYEALLNNVNGFDNTAVGPFALLNSTGASNTAVGSAAGANVSTAGNVICIGAGIGGADVSNSCYIGNIWNQSGGSQAVYVNSQGKLGAQTSSERFKDEIKPMEHTSEVIYALRPVSFRYKPEIEPTRPRCFGLIAEDVEKISRDLVTRGSDGWVNSVRYDAVNAMLLNEFLKEHKAFQEQQRKVQEQGTIIAKQQKQIEALTAGLQKVSDQLQLSKSTPQLVLSNP